MDFPAESSLLIYLKTSFLFLSTSVICASVCRFFKFKSTDSAGKSRRFQIRIPPPNHFFVKPDGSVTTYDKRHLFTYGGEKERFTGGDRRVIVEWRGVRFLLLVCYDLRFPVWMRNRGDYDAILFVANWPVVRQDAWETLLKARSIENQCYVAGVNRVGKDPVCEYLGGSALYNPFGQTVVRCKDAEMDVATGKLSMAMLEEFRAKFPVLEDADDFILK